MYGADLNDAVVDVLDELHEHGSVRPLVDAELVLREATESGNETKQNICRGNISAAEKEDVREGASGCELQRGLVRQELLEEVEVKMRNFFDLIVVVGANVDAEEDCEGMIRLVELSGELGDAGAHEFIALVTLLSTALRPTLGRSSVDVFVWHGCTIFVADRT
ncbi:hypothetical protein AURDEDRAFT_131932 [Auricularia subglabra TFB-10046 SS5]|uniref:Uncharacterized protein n=1 Tax=Auricularia subglabra (strain TFB-10046 / SS5) TaxID=717982 RepID=J0WMB6_AURST|nr:hypothetical protein AURDEDRAFT_131932 [Auricularia subglabra TFB-10046 SS5]